MDDLLETDVDLWNENDPFTEFPLRISNDDEQWLYDIIKGPVSPKADGCNNENCNGPEITSDEELLHFDENDDPMGVHGLPSISIDLESTENEKIQNFCEIEITNKNPQNGVVVESRSGFDNAFGSFVPVDSALPTVIALIEKSLLRKEGHYKDDGDVIVTKPFLDGKVKPLKFQTIDVINYGDVIKISMEAQKLEDKSVGQPRMNLGKDILDEFKCSCFTFHQGSHFCVKSENATVDWSVIEDKSEVTLRPVTPNNVHFEIGFWSTDFGKGFAAQLLFQLERDGKTTHQKYFIKTCAYLKRDLISFTKLINLNFPNRYKWFEKGSFSEEEPPQKKMKLSQSVEPALLSPLINPCPSDDFMELMNLLKEDSHFANLEW